MKTGILAGTIILLLIGINANPGSTVGNCNACAVLDTIIPRDTLERIKRDAVIEATEDMLIRVDSLRSVKDSLQMVVDSMRERPQRVLGHIDTVRALNGSKVWKWWYWKSGKKYRRFSHLEIKPL